MTAACPTPKPLLPTRPVVHKPPKPILRLAGQAIEDYRMIRAGDRILLALSGGKDSLTLLHLLLHLKSRSPVKFELAAATVDPCIDGFDPGYLKDYVPALGIPYFYRQEKIVERAATTMRGDSFCAYCARMRRGIIEILTPFSTLYHDQLAAISRQGLHHGPQICAASVKQGAHLLLGGQKCGQAND